jgi:hypothetical protein
VEQHGGARPVPEAVKQLAQVGVVVRAHRLQSRSAVMVDAMPQSRSTR